MGVADYADWVFRILSALGVSSVVLYFLKERRKNSVESEVAERTLDSTVARVDLTAIEQQLSTLRGALDMERQSKNNLIKDLREQLTEARSTIADLRAQVATLTRRIDGFESQRGETG
jgi:uncharacterized coiled-coil protein SlyX